MKKWECPECGEEIHGGVSICVCGYNENTLHYEEPQVKARPHENQESTDIPLKTIFYKIIKFIVLAHIIAYAVLIGKQTAGRPHFVGKSLMLGALWITKLYIVPVSTVVGPYSHLTKPLYFVRDGFYDLGWKAFPENDAERHMWWYAIRYSSEYCRLAGDQILPYSEEKKHSMTPAHFNSWTNELYKHIEPLGDLSLKDKKFQTLRLGSFISVSSRYLTEKWSQSFNQWTSFFSYSTLAPIYSLSPHGGRIFSTNNLGQFFQIYFLWCLTAQ